ncbi:MAG TPA: thiol:disulfide interchange protein DsbA/DsbL [Dyella sp.]|uniref:thiol:disulfide interchange protein DsbA/DsbL n=1 Tax=Dyella sp. TaxID=1869338 RepID=UPI002F94795B
MFKRLPFLFAAAMAVAACSHDSDNASAPQSPAPAASSAPAAPASTPPAATASTAPAAASTAAPASAASAPATAAAPVADAKPAAPFVDSGKWVEGKNYDVIEPQQPKVSGTDKIEVVEVFSYGCPACNLFHTTVDQMVQQLPSNATMVFLPVSFNPAENFPMFQRAYLTAQTLGVADKGADAMYDAAWKTKELSSEKPSGGLKPSDQLPTIEDAAKVYAKFGADPKEFVAVANSFAINTKMKRADELVQKYGVMQTPTIVIDGKYRYTVGQAGGYPQAIELAQWLISKEAAGK